MMKRSILTAFIFLTVFTGILFAEEDHGRDLEAVLDEIRAAQGLEQGETIDPNKVNDQLLEELGEAVMSQTHPNPRQHEWMDQMMGGEGSESLAAAHRNMGYQYLKSDGFIGPMGSGMMGSGGMMGSYGYMDYRPRAGTFFTTVLPWTLAGLLGVSVTALSIVLAARAR